SAGATCFAGGGCERGVLACVDGGAVCEGAGDSGWLEDGVACDAGSVCSSGTCLTYLAAARGALPQFANGGAGLLNDFHLVTITFQGYPYQQQVEALGDWVVTSDWLQAFVPDYGPMTGTNTNVHMSTAAPSGTLQTSDVESFLSSNISA